PYEVELFVAEVGDTAEADQIYRLTYEGSVADEHGYAAMGGSAEQVSQYLKEHYREGLELEEALRLAVDALGHDGTEPRTVTGDRLEVAVLDRTRTHPRKFRRLVGSHMTSLFGTGDVDDVEAPADIPPTDEVHGAVGDPPDDPGDAVGDLPDDRPDRPDE
ncbi:MAG: proteasome subunit alpha, partial [Actinomycetota bacterium]|nr:proteasome subunit alpha [Actinomycetota bacterium]